MQVEINPLVNFELKPNKKANNWLALPVFIVVKLQARRKTEKNTSGSQYIYKAVIYKLSWFCNNI